MGAGELSFEDKVNAMQDDLEVTVKKKTGNSAISKSDDVEDQVSKMRGTLTIRVRNVETQKIEKEVCLENVVVNNLRTQAAALLAGNSIADRAITRVGFGVGTAVESATDTALTNPSSGEVNVAVSPTYPTTDSVRFDGILGSAVGNGITFTEAGLLFYNVTPRLAARRTFGALVKSSTVQFEVAWQLTQL